jgi:hypothetical protein
MKSAISAIVLGSVVFLAPSFASAQQQKGGMEGYVVDRDGNPVISSRTGECVRSRQWTAASESPRCKPQATPAAASSGAPRK